ncbi:hypothetical protein K3165_11400 [Qipengyuania sp. 1XM1-15A]|uniref:hypothetical protein n=1 Tax=Qipengyuania xiamenensis TaxID=2867237 RepID=UPI001C8692B3|nr:hypothetical protein [Qipengyuania xiamenensis]MBX7533529.1 hypothetical protein [Qipengyuania xiamenensis]
MKLKLALGALCVALPISLVSAQDRPADEGDRDAKTERCVPATVLVPPFNDSPGALEQSRIAATTVENIRDRRGEAAYRVCRKSALAPELSEIEGVEEEPLTEEEIRELDPETASEG